VTEIEQLTVFLEALFAGGWIEIRVIEDRKDGAVLRRSWYDRPAKLVAALPQLNELADNHRAAVYYGVLPRVERNRGKAKDAIASSVVWTDIDFRDFQGGEDEARKQLQRVGWAPSVIVRSGHGIHCYWLLKEDEEAATLERLSKRLAHAVGGDHAFDAARLLRLPTTANRKGTWKSPPEPAVPVTFEVLEIARRYNPSELEDVLPPVEDVLPSVTISPEETAGVGIGAQISPVVQRLLERPRLQAIFEGRGKPAMNGHGGRLDTTSSGYDASLALMLARAGIIDPSELATAVWHRPDDAARSKGQKYCARTAVWAIGIVQREKTEKQKSVADAVDFSIDSIRVYTSNPPVYLITTGGVEIKLSTEQLLSPERFCLVYANAVRRIPRLPGKREQHVWRELVNGWMAQAKELEQPSEANETEWIRSEIKSLITRLPLGEEPDDLDAGKALADDEGHRLVKAGPLLKPLHDLGVNLRPHELCAHLRACGFESKTVKVGTEQRETVRAWVEAGA